MFNPLMKEKMEDEEFRKELKELTEMLETLRLIKDREQRKRFKAEITVQLLRVMKKLIKDSLSSLRGGDREF